jgi:Transcription factor WhiB
MTVGMSWREDAACSDTDPDLFFPIGTTGNTLRQIEAAKRICLACPAQLQCLAWALFYPNSMAIRRYRDGTVTRTMPGSLVQPGM